MDGFVYRGQFVEKHSGALHHFVIHRTREVHDDHVGISPDHDWHVSSFKYTVLESSIPSSDLNVGALVGGLIGGLVGLAAIAVVTAWLVVRHRRRTRAAQQSSAATAAATIAEAQTATLGAPLLHHDGQTEMEA